MTMYFCCSRLVCRRTIIYSQHRCLRRLHEQTEKRKKIHFEALSRYMQFIKRYTDVLDKNFPTAMRLYRQFTYGVKDYMIDLKAYLLIVKKVNLSIPGINSLTLKELELYHTMPKEIIKITPLIVFSIFPFANYVIFPLAYYFPRQLLTRHFWSLQQRSEFAIVFQKKRLKWYKPVFRSLQAQLDDVDSHDCYKEWEYVIRLLGSGLHPSTATIIKCKPLFSESPYHLRRLYQSHVRVLLKMHNMHTGWRRRSRLAERAALIQLMDQAIVMEGGVTKLSIEELKWACSFRGLSPTNMKTEDMVTWLNQWLSISKEIDENSYSLLLHCPILLSYNHPSNWVISHEK